MWEKYRNKYIWFDDYQNRSRRELNRIANLQSIQKRKGQYIK